VDKKGEYQAEMTLNLGPYQAESGLKDVKKVQN
jgi:hypothetical protein